MPNDEFDEEEFLNEIEDIYEYHSSEFDELPPIEFKDHIEEDLSNYRFTLFFCLLFAVIGAFSLAFIAPIITLITGPFYIVERGVIENYSMWNPIIGGLIGAMFGALIGWIIEALLHGISSDRTHEA